jgi:hypothetical protein
MGREVKRKGREDGRWRMEDCLGWFFGFFGRNGHFKALIADTYTNKYNNTNTSIAWTHRDVAKDDVFWEFGAV